MLPASSHMKQFDRRSLKLTKKFIFLILNQLQKYDE